MDEAGILNGWKSKVRMLIATTNATRTEFRA